MQTSRHANELHVESMFDIVSLHTEVQLFVFVLIDHSVRSACMKSMYNMVSLLESVELFTARLERV